MRKSLKMHNKLLLIIVLTIFSINLFGCATTAQEQDEQISPPNAETKKNEVLLKTKTVKLGNWGGGFAGGCIGALIGGAMTVLIAPNLSTDGPDFLLFFLIPTLSLGVGFGAGGILLKNVEVPVQENIEGNTGLK